MRADFERQDTKRLPLRIGREDNAGEPAKHEREKQQSGRGEAGFWNAAG